MSQASGRSRSPSSAAAISCLSRHAAVARDAIVPSLWRGDAELHELALASATTAVELSADSPEPWPMYCRLMAIFTYMSFRQPEVAAEHAAMAIAAPPQAPFLDLHATLRAYAAIAALVLGDDARAVALAAELLHTRRADAVLAARTCDGVGSSRCWRRPGHRAAGATRLPRRLRGLAWYASIESVVLLGGVLSGMREDWPACSLLLAASTPAIDRTPADALLYWTFRDRARGVLGHERSQKLRAAGRALSIDEALAITLDL